MRPRLYLSSLLLATCALISSSALAVTLSIDSTTIAESGQVAPLCVSMDTGGAPVAGTENRIYWDLECATPVVEGCRASAAHGKNLYSRINDPAFDGGDPFLKTLVISLSDSNAMPDGELYCCNFTVDLANPGDCCEVRVERPLVSSPDAEALATDAGPPGAICLDPDAAPRTPIIPDTRTPTWTPSPGFATQTPTVTSVPDEHEAPPRTATLASSLRTPREGLNPSTAGGGGGSGDDDGCQVVASESAGIGAWMLCVPVLVLGAAAKRRRALLRLAPARR